MRIKKWILMPAFLAPVCASFCVACSKEIKPYQYAKYKVKWPFNVIDGDTIYFDNGSKRQGIRIFGIDTPEAYKSFQVDKNKQLAKLENFYGVLAKELLIKKLWQKDITIQYITQDKYNRWVCRIFDKNNYDIGKYIISQGLARIQYFSLNKKDKWYWINDSELKGYYYELLKTQQSAQSQLLGFWKENINDVYHK